MKLLSLVLLVSACGTANQSSPSAQSGVGTAKVDTTITQPNATPTAPNNTNSYHTLAVESANIPVCDSTAESDLVYVLDQKQFKVCSNNTWVVVDIAGPSGTPGKDGKNGTNGAPGTPTPGNEWLNPITNVTWFLGGWGSYAQAQAVCTGQFRLPTETEAQLAYTSAIPSHPDMWTSTPENGGHFIAGVVQTIFEGTGNTYDYTDAGQHGITCIQN